MASCVFCSLGRRDVRPGPGLESQEPKYLVLRIEDQRKLELLTIAPIDSDGLQETDEQYGDRSSVIVQ